MLRSPAAAGHRGRVDVRAAFLLLASVGVLKFITMGAAVSLMALNQARVGVAISPVELVVFPLITLVNLTLATALLRSVTPEACLASSTNRTNTRYTT